MSLDQTITMSLDQTINEAIAPIANKSLEIVFFSAEIMGQSVPLILVWLVVASVFFTFYMRLVNIHLFKHAIELDKKLV